MLLLLFSQKRIYIAFRNTYTRAAKRWHLGITCTGFSYQHYNLKIGFRENEIMTNVNELSRLDG